MTLPGAFDELRADYNAARTTRFRKRLTGVSAMGSHADYHYRSEADYLRVMELSRSFDRNDMVVGQGVSRLIQNVLQGGVTVDPDTGDDDANTYLKKKFGGWSEDAEQCDKAGELNLHAKAKLTLRHVLVDGDICHLPLDEGSLESIEGHRLRTPRNTKRNVVHGVLLNATRRRLEYWFTRDDVDPSRAVHKVGEMKRYAARDADGNRQVFHVYMPKRFSQTRGITAFAPIVDPVGMHDDLQFAKLVQAQIVSCWALVHNYDKDFEPPAGDAPAKGAQEVDQHRDGARKLLEGISPGMEVFGEPGEKIEGFSPNVPNAEFFPHTMLILTFIAINLNLPLAVLLLDPSKTNFSGWRGAIDQARMGFREIQLWMIDQFYRPVYQWKVRQWLDPASNQFDSELAAFAARDGVDLLRHRWHPPTWSYIEPNKDAQADGLIIKSRLNSRRRTLAKRGLDVDEVDREIITDNKAFILSAIEAVNEINKAHPDAGVDWREVAGFDLKGRPNGSGGRARTTEPSQNKAPESQHA